MSRRLVYGAMLSDKELAMYLLLTDEPQRPGHLGTLLWPKKGSTPSAYARPAGKILNHLRDEGLAKLVFRGDTWGWVRRGSQR